MEGNNYLIYYDFSTSTALFFNKFPYQAHNPKHQEFCPSWFQTTKIISTKTFKQTQALEDQIRQNLERLPQSF